jgi:hypothetical protein
LEKFPDSFGSDDSVQEPKIKIEITTAIFGRKDNLIVGFMISRLMFQNQWEKKESHIIY